MSRAELEPTIPVLELPKTTRTLNRAAAGSSYFTSEQTDSLT
jgi:hypothetical protein